LLTTSYVDTVEDNEEYCYKIVAVYEEGNSEFSNVSCASVPVPPYYAPPTNCKTEYLQDYDLSTTWEAPEEGTPKGYHVYKDGVQITEDLWATMLYVDTVDDNEDHCYKIVAIYEEGNSDFSNQSCAFVPESISGLTRKVNIYPNPAKDKIFIESEFIIGQKVEIYDISGRIVANKEVNSNVTMMDIADLMQGVYVIKVSNAVVGKFVKE
jgi:predicted DNA-binding ArsR family transcriptional regulator